MTPDRKILHALNRLAFGPRAGDIEAVRQTGLDRWIESQLNPQSIPEDTLLVTKLEPLDTLRMSSAGLVQKYPSPQMVRAMAAGRMPFPSDPEAQYMARRLADRFRNKQGIDQKGPANTPARLETLRGGWGLEEEQKRLLETGTPAEQVKLLESLPEATQLDILGALPNGRRQRLYASAPADLRRKIRISAGPVQAVNQDLMEGKLLRAVYGSRQLEEVLTDFWYNHFNVFLDKGADRYMVTSYERDVIRPHVLGSFEDLLLATARSPAMLFYLDNWQSVGQGPRSGPRRGPRANARRRRGLNENYGRELMELHTLGVDGGYTQKDVTEVARCFTGWTIREPQRGGGFEFNERLHDSGEKHVLGVKIPAGGGLEDGLRVISILAHSPATARHISRSLAMRFVADDPPDALVQGMAKRFLETDGDLREVMRAMIASGEFWNPANFRSKMKSPLEMVASAVRAVDGDIDFATSLAGLMNQMGEPLYRKLEPTGYSNRSTDWMNSASLLVRMNFAIALAQNKVPGIHVDTAQFTSSPAQIERRILFTEPAPGTRSAVEAASNGSPEGPLVAGLTLGSPDFQRR